MTISFLKGRIVVVGIEVDEKEKIDDSNVHGVGGQNTYTAARLTDVYSRNK